MSLKKFHFFKESKKAQMQMSVGTIVTIVLLMTVLVLGLVLTRTIFRSSTESVNQIDQAIQNEISKLFAEEGKKIVIYPTSRQISIKKGDEPRGFAFSVKNTGTEDREFGYTVKADPNFNYDQCGSGFTSTKADSWLLTKSGSFSIVKGNSLDLPELVLINIPDDAPLCVVSYIVDVDEKGGAQYAQAKVFLTVQ